MALNGIPISEDQCIGDSLDTINSSFTELDSRTLNLSSSIDELYVKLDNPLSSKVKLLGNGLTNSFSVSSLIGSNTNAFLYRVDINGAVQEPGESAIDGDYYLTAGNVIFSTPPLNGTKIIVLGPVNS